MTLPLPHLRRGALARVDPLIGLVPLSLTVFQYNPAELSRTLTARKGDRQSWLGAVPEETLAMKIELDATDPRDHNPQQTLPQTIYPALSALEMLLCQPVAVCMANLALSRLGALQVLPPRAAVSVLLWGRRIVPVQVNRLGIQETAFDGHLNPIRAEVDLDLQVLSHQELGFLSVGTFLHFANQIQREVFASSEAQSSAFTALSSFSL